MTFMHTAIRHLNRFTEADIQNKEYYRFADDDLSNRRSIILLKR